MRGEDTQGKRRTDRGRRRFPLLASDARVLPTWGSTFCATTSPRTRLFAKLRALSPALIRLYPLVTLCPCVYTGLFYLIYLLSLCLRLCLTTRGSLNRYRPLGLRILLRCQDLRDPRLLPPHLRDSLVQDPRGPARLLRIREDNIDNARWGKEVSVASQAGRLHKFVPSGH